MAIATSAQIHPTAVIDPRAEIGEGCRVGPFVVIDGPVKVGPDCELRPGAQVMGDTTLGEGNVVHSYAVLGDAPQHQKYAGEPTRLVIGSHNVFREHVTVHRGMTLTGVTTVGSHNFLMAGSHVGHDCVVGDYCVLANQTMLGGSAVLADRVLMSGSSAVHQFVKVGRLALISGLSGSTMDVPPFVIVRSINIICGVNVIGMRRAGISNPAIDAVRKAFGILYKGMALTPVAVAEIEAKYSAVPEVMEFVGFIRAAKRGVSRDCVREAA
ncbi:MAG: acyl-ACP--UDP-N-acetylglucosamine O-acyltransferase [Gemmataceae bacterium]